MYLHSGEGWVASPRRPLSRAEPGKLSGLAKQERINGPIRPIGPISRDVLSSLLRSQIFREFVSDAGSGSGILRLCRTIPLLFGEKILKTVCFN
jgi:hypothetical protein